MAGPLETTVPRWPRIARATHDVVCFLMTQPNGLELSRPDALGSPLPTLLQHQWGFEWPFSAAVRVGSSELLGGLSS